MFEGPQEELTRTENAQPAILTTSIALLRVLETEHGLDLKESCRFALGHSLGEYSALVATRALRLADAVRLVVSSPLSTLRSYIERKPFACLCCAENTPAWLPLLRFLENTRRCNDEGSDEQEGNDGHVGARRTCL